MPRPQMLVNDGSRTHRRCRKCTELLGSGSLSFRRVANQYRPAIVCPKRTSQTLFPSRVLSPLQLWPQFLLRNPGRARGRASQTYRGDRLHTESDISFLAKGKPSLIGDVCSSQELGEACERADYKRRWGVTPLRTVSDDTTGFSRW